MFKMKSLEKNEYFKNLNLDYAFDSLSKVLNRETICTYIQFLIDHNLPFSVCISDIDNFKTINDTYGHMIGDRVISSFAKYLIDIVGDRCIIGRYGGDEFFIIAEGITEYDDIWNICHMINKHVTQVSVEELTFLSITITTGVSRFPIDGKTYSEIFQTADKALYRGKSKGRNCFIIYLPEKHANIKLSGNPEFIYNSMDSHNKIFSILTGKGSLNHIMHQLLQYLSSTLMLDHICIQTNHELLLTLVHPLSRIKSFHVIPSELLIHAANNSGLFYVTNKNTLLKIHLDELYNALKSQKINSTLSCTIEAYGQFYGILRADATITNRMWQPYEMDLILTAAKLLGVILYLSNQKLD